MKNKEEDKNILIFILYKIHNYDNENIDLVDAQHCRIEEKCDIYDSPVCICCVKMTGFGQSNILGNTVDNDDIYLKKISLIKPVFESSNYFPNKLRFYHDPNELSIISIEYL